MKQIYENRVESARFFCYNKPNELCQNQNCQKMNPEISISKERLAPFCRERGIRWLAVFGSALRTDFRPDSDVDVLVRFRPERTPGLLGMARIEREMSELFGQRKIDLRTPEDLSQYFRQKVLAEAEVQYADG